VAQALRAPLDVLVVRKLGPLPGGAGHGRDRRGWSTRTE
jgi:hypothetical protein